MKNPRPVLDVAAANRAMIENFNEMEASLSQQQMKDLMRIASLCRRGERPLMVINAAMSLVAANGTPPTEPDAIFQAVAEAIRNPDLKTLQVRAGRSY